MFREEGEIGSKSREEGEIGSESREKGDLPPLFHSPQYEVSKIFIISLLCVLTSSGTIFIQEERHKISEAGRKQNESI